ncbi:proline-rich receptor-like protein kinase PERK8 [Penaeus chinensis]|uniref:proline-rich receptor-like protein kinase PERK8 n=1 Tax=Penaeus chinensis TaxID=139456 RepID=UPI001FB70936|nr:proline-rich receptor-like protein kinase PERK8 [Penaeus chinensis]
MVVLRRKLNKAKLARGDSEYRLRVEDVAHLTHLDETSNTYVNTTDLQKLVSSVRAKKKAEEKLPLPPRLQQQAPPLVRKPTSPSVSARSSASSAGQADNDAFRGDVDVVTLRPPMPLPHPKPDILQGVLPPRTGAHGSEPVSEIIYSNVHPPSQPTPQSPVTKGARIEPPKIAPPPPPAKKPKREEAVTVSPAVVSVGEPEEKDAPVSPTVIARPAPPPPVAKPTAPAGSSPANTTDRNAAQKPTPPVAPKPQKAVSSDAPTPTRTPPLKPTLPKAAKPGVLSKGRGLPPLKMALLHSDSRSSIDSCATPDTSVLMLTPDVDEERGSASISAKIAFLEGKMKSPATVPRGMPSKT